MNEIYVIIHAEWMGTILYPYIDKCVMHLASSMEEVEEYIEGSAALCSWWEIEVRSVDVINHIPETYLFNHLGEKIESIDYDTTKSEFIIQRRKELENNTLEFLILNLVDEGFDTFCDIETELVADEYSSHLIRTTIWKLAKENQIIIGPGYKLRKNDVIE